MNKNDLKAIHEGITEAWDDGYAKGQMDLADALEFILSEDRTAERELEAVRDLIESIRATYGDSPCPTT